LAPSSSARGLAAGQRRRSTTSSTRACSRSHRVRAPAVGLQAYEFVDAGQRARALARGPRDPRDRRAPRFTFRDYARVLEPAAEALIDPITGLGNRRMLMRDLTS
jgi:GGDEF domain-containing protein